MTAFAGLAEYIDHFRMRVVQDAFTEATAVYRTRRAEAFRAAMPQPGDYTGHATVDQLEDRRRQLAELESACRCRAAVSIVGGGVP